MTLGLAASGCGAATTTVAIPNLPQAMPVNSPDGSYMLTVNSFAGDALQKMLLLRMSSGSGILTTSFVNLHDFDETSAFGRVVSQQIGSRLSQYGFRVLEARLASTLSMTPRVGEFLLTREAARLLADSYDANAVLVGGYSDAGGKVFVSARVVRLSDNVILGAYEYVLPRDSDVSRLLAGNGAWAGDSFWRRHSEREQAFTGSRARNVIPAHAPVTAGSGATPSAAASPAKSAAASRQESAGVPVPRHVASDAAPAAPAAKAPAPVVPEASSAAPGGPAPVSSPILPLQKDAPSPSSIPGGV